MLVKFKQWLDTKRHLAYQRKRRRERDRKWKAYFKSGGLVR